MKAQEKELIETNVINVGSPCCPLPVIYYKNGERDERTAVGRKYSLAEIHQKMMDKHRHLMQLYTNTQISNMSREDIITPVSKVVPCAMTEFESNK